MFLRQSQCGFNGFSPLVCCPETTLLRPAAVRSEKLVLPKSVLPKPPTCGNDLEDRIFGGTKTSIFEFPWFALLKYSRRKFLTSFTDILKHLDLNFSGLIDPRLFV